MNVGTTNRARRRIDFPQPGQAVPDYVNLYRIGSKDEPGPLILYVGGAITARQHAERYDTEPLPILAEFDRALATAPVGRLDLVIAPSPVRRVDPSDALDAYEDFFHDQLLPSLGGAPPGAMAFVGYSYGAHLVTGLALGQDLARALVTIGGAGVGEAARAAGRSVAPGLVVAMFHNEGDDLPPPGPAARQFLGCPEPRVMPARPGGHGFGSYAANGSVSDAFGLALALVQ